MTKVLNIAYRSGDEFNIGLNELASRNVFQYGDSGMYVTICHTQQGYSIEKVGDRAILAYESSCDFYFALSILLGHYNDDMFSDSGERRIECLYSLVDCSRNAVRTVATLKEYIVSLALLGYNGLYLYLENTYVIESEPYWGYARGSYTKEEIKGIVDFASKFNIEVIPAIQTLAHLGAALRWDYFNEYKDTEDILLIDDDKTYILIDKMLESLSESFSTKKINLGLDEAHFVGLGNYLNKFGYVERKNLMLKHLQKVYELCIKHGFVQPKMWSDMLFRLINGGSYSVKENSEFTSLVPDGMQLIFWDYYSLDKEYYQRMMNAHKKISNNIAFACGGGYTWFGFTPCNKCAYERLNIAFPCVKNNNINEVIVTFWADNGAECSCFSGFATLVYASNFRYHNADSPERRNILSLSSSKYPISAWESLDLPNKMNDDVNKLNSSSKYLLYGDILLGIFDKHIDYGFAKYYDRAIAELSNSKIGNDKDYIFDVLIKLCNVLKLKTSLSLDLKRYYDDGDKIQLKNCVTILDRLITKTQEFYDAVIYAWEIENKSFGVEVLDVRLGGLIARLRHAKTRINNYIEFDKEIEELKQSRLEYLVYPCYDFITNSKENCSFVAFMYHELFTAGIN